MHRFACVSWQTPLQLVHEHSSRGRGGSVGVVACVRPLKNESLCPQPSHAHWPWSQQSPQQSRLPLPHVPHPCAMHGACTSPGWGSELHPCPMMGGGPLQDHPSPPTQVLFAPRSGREGGFVLPVPGWSPPASASEKVSLNRCVAL